MLTPPAVRFVRGFDIVQYRMVNVWMTLTTQAQIDNPPNAVELTVTARTVEEALVEIKKRLQAWRISPEVLTEIEQASHRLILGKDPLYGTLEEVRSGEKG